MTAEPLPTLAELGPLSDREWRIYALAYSAGCEDGHDRGFVDGVQVRLDAEPSARPARRHLRLVAS